MNGWQNWATWNVALWIQNDRSLNLLASRAEDYMDFATCMTACWVPETPDGACYEDPELNLNQLNALIADLSAGASQHQEAAV